MIMEQLSNAPRIYLFVEYELFSGDDEFICTLELKRISVNQMIMGQLSNGPRVYLFVEYELFSGDDEFIHTLQLKCNSVLL